MKSYTKYILVLFTISFISCTNSLKGQAPKAVDRAFKLKYPKENDPDWKKDKNGYFEASFKKGKKHYRADFKPNGEWVETERSINKDDLPKRVRNIIEKDFEDVKIYEIEEVQHPTKGLFYDVEFKINGKKKDIEFNGLGQIISK